MNEIKKHTGPFPLDSDSFWLGLLGKLRIILGAPLIYSLFLPMLFFHLCLEIYHQICFPIFAIPKLRQGQYFIFDRHRLPYLNPLEKLNCLYCSYFNNLMAYAREIGGRTERHWCPIKQAMKRMSQHEHYTKFFEYGDQANFKEKHKLIRIYEAEEKR